MEEELSMILWRLSHDIVNAIETLKKDGKIQKVRKIWFREKTINFEYKEGSISWQASPEYFEREEWDWKYISQIIELEIKKLPAYINAYKCISEIYNVDEFQAEFWLSKFAHNVVTKTLDTPLSEEGLLESVILFLNDLEQRPIIWNVIVELEGLWLKDEEIKINKGLKIRRPRPEDLEFERPFEEILLPRVDILPVFRHFSAVLEVTQKTQFMWDELEKLIVALRLYKLGSVVTRRITWKPKSILQFGATTWPTFIQPVVYCYSLSSEESLKLKTFLDKIRPLLPVVQGRIETIDYISISLQRYNDALFKSDPTERLAYAIMGLEALFLKSSEREELAHRLAQRVARCLSLYSYQPLEVYRIIVQSYDIRSNFVHGSLVGKEKSHDASTLAEKVIKYLRILILMFLELKNRVEKDSFLNTIDNSLIHPDALAKLEKLIKENCPITTSIISA
jgi:hypothetical protein